MQTNHLRQNLLVVLYFLLVTIVSGCGGSDTEPDSEEKTSVNPAGIWIGTQTVMGKYPDGSVYEGVDYSGDVYSSAHELTLLIYGGRYFGFSRSADIGFNGTYAMGHNGRMVSNGLEGGDHSYKTYSMSEEGENWVNGVATMNFAEKEGFIGQYQNDELQEGELQALYSNLYDKGASIDYLVGRYEDDVISIEIDEDGVISGSKKGCELNGTFSIPEPEKNLYLIDYRLSGETCTKTGTYSGLGTVALADGSAYFMSLSTDANDTRMDGLGFSLEETPSVFAFALIDNAISDYLGLKNGKKLSDTIAAALDPNNWPGIIDIAHATTGLAYEILKALDVNYLEDHSDSNILSTSDFYFNTLRVPDSRGMFHEIGYVDFENSDFNGITMPGPRDEIVQLSSMKHIKYDGSDLSDVVFSLPIYICSFSNANLEGSNISDFGVFVLEDPSLENFIGNDFSGAWWEDGHRCGIDVALLYADSQCEPNIVDSGLTYEEWKSGKWEAEKIAENIADGVTEAVNSGVDLVVGSAEEVSNFVTNPSRWF